MARSQNGGQAHGDDGSAHDGSEGERKIERIFPLHYPPFRDAAIPFIQNIEIRYDLRGRGYGGRVLEAVERLIGERSSKAGICVALFDAYGPAQRLYAKRGYIPDGRGACRRSIPLQRGETITLNDDHLIWLVKELRAE